ncbi:MAG: hypothetical protein CMF12_14915 [Idiomarina sp.]|uniref:hypothetical protein n=1 Tax=Idiomarina sp. TaxID=1874361 RepID=UPI000C4B2704|nr:hypothetical protein [Idiomarina sp.]MBT43799.1 hypothetical protein [Idiomarina sp.]
MALKQNQSRILFSLTTSLIAIMVVSSVIFSEIGFFKFAALWFWSLFGIIVVSSRFSMKMLSEAVISYGRAYGISLLIILWPVALVIKSKSRTI